MRTGDLGTRDGWFGFARELVRAGIAGGALSDREGFARLLFVHACAGGSLTELPAAAAALRSWALSEPRSDSQAVVDAADIAQALWMRDSALWRELDLTLQRELAAWFERCAIAAARTSNNWRLFAMVLADFMEAAGHGSARLRALRARSADAVERSYRGDGWYSDGGERTFDYYTSWSYHFTLALLAELNGSETEAAVARERVVAFLPQLGALLGTDGAPVAFGRSLTYRFGVCAAYSAAALLGAGDGARLRRATETCVRWFDDGEDAALPLGWTSEIETAVQSYSGPFASYWAGRIFVSLLLTPEDPYWSGDPAVTPAPTGTTRLPVPNFLVTSTPGMVRLANHGSYDRTATDLRRTPEEVSYQPLLHSNRFGHVPGSVPWGGFLIRDAAGVRSRARIRPLGGGADWAASTATMRHSARRMRWLGRRYVRSVPRPRSAAATFASLSRAEWDVHVALVPRRLLRGATVEFAGWPGHHDEDVAALRATAGDSVVVGLEGLGDGRVDADGALSVPVVSAHRPRGSLFAAATAIAPASAPPVVRMRDGVLEVEWADGARHGVRMERAGVRVEELEATAPRPDLANPCIVILTYQRPAGLARLLRSLEPELHSAAARVLVVDNDASGSARGVVRDLAPDATYLIEPTPGIAQARNAALRALPVDADSVIFVDDDEEVRPGWLRALLDFANLTGADVVAGRVEFVTDLPAGRLPQLGYLDPLPLRTGTRLIDAATNNVLMRRATWEALREPLFDVAYSETGGSDNAFFRHWHDAGATLLHTESAVVCEHLGPERLTVRWQARRALRVGVVKGRLWRERRGAWFAAGRGVVAAAAGGVELLGCLVTGRGMRALPTRRVLSGVGQFLSVFGYRVPEYRRAA